jgi:hypothetical protein
MIVVIIVLCVLAIPFIIAAFSSRYFAVSRQIIIAKPLPDVFNYIKHLKNQSNYSKWVMMDPNAKMEFTGVDGTVGFISAWDSENKNVGKGEQEIKAIVEGEKMDVEVRFEKPFAATGYANFTTEAVDANSTLITWEFSGPRNYMMTLMHLLLNIKKTIGGDLMTGLTNLKNVLEQA